jgi:hypothetical protein
MKCLALISLIAIGLIVWEAVENGHIFGPGVGILLVPAILFPQAVIVRWLLRRTIEATDRERGE